MKNERGAGEKPEPRKAAPKRAAPSRASPNGVAPSRASPNGAAPSRAAQRAAAPRWIFPKRAVLFFALLGTAAALHAQAGRWETFWALDAGIASNDILVEGVSLGLVLDPSISLTPRITIGSKNVINFSTDETMNIVALETQAYFRWNFLRLRNPERPTNIFAQGGVGLVAAYRGADVQMTRGSVLVDGTAGITIPVSSRWHIEPSVRVGYPFIAGVSVTAGRRFPLRLPSRIEYREIIRIPPPTEIVKRITIVQVEYVIFGPDISAYNDGIDADARALNDLVIGHTVEVLKENPNYVVRLEGHANPLTYTPAQFEDLVALSEERADEVAGLLKARGVPEEQIVVAAFGGARTAARDFDHRNMNRRVELIIKEIAE